MYDPRTKIAYMHGGNDGLERDEIAEGLEYDNVGEQGPHDSDSNARVRSSASGRENRLDDFWSMHLQRLAFFFHARILFNDMPSPGADEIIRRATFEIRQQT